MMGGSHAISGAAAWVAVTSTGPLMLGISPLPPQGIILGSVVAAGAALLPDFDHHSGTAAYSLPPLTKVMARSVANISGGHRHGTHSILGILVATAIASLLSLIKIPVDLPIEGHSGVLNLGSAIVMLFCAALGLKALKLTKGSGWLWPWTYSLGMAGMVAVFAPSEFGWLTLAVGLGCLVHCLGDMLTVGGWPIFYPFYPKHPRWLRSIVRGAVSPAAYFTEFKGLPMTWNPMTWVIHLCQFVGHLMLYIPRFGFGWFIKMTLGKIWYDRNGFFAIPLLGTTGGFREWVFASVLLTPYASLGIMWAVCDYAEVPPEDVLASLVNFGDKLFGG